MSTVVSSSSDCVDNTGCRLRKISSGSSLHTTQTVATPSTNLNNNALSSAGSGPNAINNSSSSNRQCCFHWCCCCRPCSCLALKAVHEEPKPQGEVYESSENLIITAEEPPSEEEIRMWGENFDRLIKSIAGRRIFREFLRCEYSEENILFWEACENLKKEKDANVIEERARLIYEDFISILSPKEVSLDSKVRDLINKNMNSPTIYTFDEGQTQIYTLMQRDSYPRFLNSVKFKKLLNPAGVSEIDSDSTKGSVKDTVRDTSSRTSSVRRKKSEA